MNCELLQGDCREVLKTLPDNSVNCCVTSPPYFGLRDYGHAGQIGLEQTPEAYVSELVAVFREVRRVLRDDGTLFLNLGDSYNAAGRIGHGTRIGYKQGTNRASDAGADHTRSTDPGLKDKDLIGIPWRVAFALQQPWEKVNIKDRIDRAWLAALVDGEGCMTIMQAQNGEKSATSFPPVLQVKMCDPECIEKANQITGFEQCLRQGSPSRGGTRDTYQWRITGRRASDIAAEIYPFLLIKRKQAVILWNHQMVRDSYETKRGQPMPAAAREKQIVCRQLIQKLNQKQHVDLPSWMVEPSITVEPGWYLRQDVIWAKPNPMPESVTDRCTKSHEYIFLLSKSARYYFDAEAIAEPVAESTLPRSLRAQTSSARECGVPGQSPHSLHEKRGRGGRNAFRGQGHFRDAENGPANRGGRDMRDIGTSATRNKRDVWTVATQPYKGAHFATFPPALILPCILAGCPSGGTVLDCFGGSGTTGEVAERLGRNSILIELNPAYIEIQKTRTQQQGFAI